MNDIESGEWYEGFFGEKKRVIPVEIDCRGCKKILLVHALQHEDGDFWTSTTYEGEYVCSCGHNNAYDFERPGWNGTPTKE